MAERIAAFVIETWPLERMDRDLSLETTDNALIIAYHEFMWEALELLDQRGTVSKPATFANPQEAQPTDIGDLFFVVDGRQTRDPPTGRRA